MTSHTTFSQSVPSLEQHQHAPPFQECRYSGSNRSTSHHTFAQRVRKAYSKAIRASYTRHDPRSSSELPATWRPQTVATRCSKVRLSPQFHYQPMPQPRVLASRVSHPTPDPTLTCDHR